MMCAVRVIDGRSSGGYGYWAQPLAGRLSRRHCPRTLPGLSGERPQRPRATLARDAEIGDLTADGLEGVEQRRPVLGRESLAAV